jgi:hypothetical protein
LRRSEVTLTALIHPEGSITSFIPPYFEGLLKILFLHNSFKTLNQNLFYQRVQKTKNGLSKRSFAFLELGLVVRP